MGIPQETRDYIDSQIDYYISEAGAYRQIAESYCPEIESVQDTAFGIIAGCVYSAFLQACSGRQKSPSLQDVQEFNLIMKAKAPMIRRAVAGAPEDGPGAPGRGG